MPGNIQNLHFVEIDSAFCAQKAAALAEKGKYDFLIVKDRGEIVGLFFPEYLKQILHSNEADIVYRYNLKALPAENISLVEIIEQIDAQNIDFHSELVNVSPNIWKCRSGVGHITFSNPCPIHNTMADPL
jgi:hypothetical protein